MLSPYTKAVMNFLLGKSTLSPSRKTNVIWFLSRARARTCNPHDVAYPVPSIYIVSIQQCGCTTQFRPPARSHRNISNYASPSLPIDLHLLRSSPPPPWIPFGKYQFPGPRVKREPLRIFFPPSLFQYRLLEIASSRRIIREKLQYNIYSRRTDELKKKKQNKTNAPWIRKRPATAWFSWKFYSRC